MAFPNRIKELIGDELYGIDDLGCSKADIFLFSQMVLKVASDDEEAKVEHQMLSWLQDKVPVPKVIDYFRQDGKSYLLMSRMQGQEACHGEQLLNPELTVKGLAMALKMLWRVDISHCPVNQCLEHKLKRAKAQVDQGLVDMEDWQDTSKERFRSPQELFGYLDTHRPVENIVVVHGDYCLPNVFLLPGKVAGFIDVGRGGIGDRWQDIALCIRSSQYNFKTDAYQGLLLQELGIPLDQEKLDYYILLDELF